MLCQLCPELTNNMENWCEDCIATNDVQKSIERIDKNRKTLKVLMKDPNWEDWAHPHDMC